MTKKSAYLPGQPCWADCATDLELAGPFYEALFGWTLRDERSQGQIYRMATHSESEVAGLFNEATPERRWHLYFSVVDVEATALRVLNHGGRVHTGSIDVGDEGIIAYFRDPEGVAFAAWQPGLKAGFGEVNAPATFCWAELTTADVVSARSFYSAVFDWSVKDGTHDVMDYTLFQLNEKTVVGAALRSDDLASEVPSFWGVYFLVVNTDDTVATVERLGGRCVRRPMNIPEGRFASCADPGGAIFNVLSLPH